MNSRKSAKAIPSTLNRFLKSRALLKSPPPAFYPLAAHPPPASLVRSFPTRHEQDLSPRSPTRSVLRSQREAEKHALNSGMRLQPHQLLDQSPLQPQGPRTSSTTATRRKPPKKLNPKNARPERIVFPEDPIRERFYADHPFEAYRPIDLVESDSVRSQGIEGQEWTELRQKTLNPSPEDCISFIQNLVASHSVPLASAYPLGITQYRTLRAEHETSTLSARLQAQAHGATFFGEIERSVLVEEKVLDEWVRAKEIQDGYAVQGGAGAQQQQSLQPSTLTVGSEWMPVEGRPAQLGSTRAGQVSEGEAKFTGGRDYLNEFTRQTVPVQTE